MIEARAETGVYDQFEPRIFKNLSRFGIIESTQCDAWFINGSLQLRVEGAFDNPCPEAAIFKPLCAHASFQPADMMFFAEQARAPVGGFYEVEVLEKNRCGSLAAERK